MARTLAQAASIPAPAPKTVERAEADPARWLTEAELVAVEILTDSHIRKLQERLDFYAKAPERAQELARRGEAERRGEADRARERARLCWVKTEQLRRDELPVAIEAAQADFVAAVDAARAIVAGPGLFNRRARQIETAKTERAAIARRWDTKALPGAEVSDVEAARVGAERAAAILGAQIARAEADATANQRQPMRSGKGSSMGASARRQPWSASRPTAPASLLSLGRSKDNESSWTSCATSVAS